MKRVTLILSLFIVSIMCSGLSMQSFAWNETCVQVVNGAYKGLECEYVIKPEIFDERDASNNTIEITIKKGSKTVFSDTVEYTKNEYNNGKRLTFTPASTGEYTITAKAALCNEGKITVNVKEQSKLKAFNAYISNRNVVFTSSSIEACFNYEKYTTLDSHKCKVKVQFKKGSKVLKTKTYTQPETTDSSFTNQRSVKYKASSSGTYSIVFTHYIDGKACYKTTKSIKVITKKGIKNIKPELFMNFDQSIGKCMIYEDKICKNGVCAVKIYRSSKKSSGYKLIKTIKKPDYEIYKGSIKSGYYYKIKVVTKSGGKTYTSKYSNIVKTPAKASAPTVNDISVNSLGKVTITCKKISGADRYLVYYKVDGGKYSDVPCAKDSNIISNYYTEKGDYTFKVCAYIHKEHYNIWTKYAYKSITIS